MKHITIEVTQEDIENAKRCWYLPIMRAHSCPIACSLVRKYPNTTFTVGPYGLCSVSREKLCSVSREKTSRSFVLSKKAIKFLQKADRTKDEGVEPTKLLLEVPPEIMEILK